MPPFLKATLCSAALAAALPASAEESPKAPEWLFVQTAPTFIAQGETLSLPYTREIFAFTERPARQHAHLSAHEFVGLWAQGEGDFTQVPPNAVLTWQEGGVPREAELVLTAAQVADFGRTITYSVVVEAGDALPASGGAASLFVDGAYTGGDCKSLCQYYQEEKRKEDQRGKEMVNNLLRVLPPSGPGLALPD